jgi:hypothetical protein
MRLVHWLFLVSVALFISGIGFIVVAARPAAQATEPAKEAIPITPVASVKQIMGGIVAPSARVVFDAVSTIVDATGIHEKAPKDDGEWAAVGSSAAALVEAGNLLLMGDRAVDRGDWVKMTRAMVDAGNTALKAADAKSTEGILAAGEVVNASCDNCHQRYQRN